VKYDRVAFAAKHRAASYMALENPATKRLVMDQPDWDEQFAETESERNARLRRKRERNAKVVANNAPTSLTPMGMTRELVNKWHEEHFGLKIDAWKLELLASRIAVLMVENSLEAVRGFEDYNGKHQIAVMRIDALIAALVQHNCPTREISVGQCVERGECRCSNAFLVQNKPLAD